LGRAGVKARVLVPGSAEGSLLRLDHPVSFWGGVDPATSGIIATGHPQRGVRIAGRVIALERSIGSSSGSSILLELLANGLGPAGIILGETDLILSLGAVVAREMGYADIPVLQLAVTDFDRVPGDLRIDEDGNILARRNGS
jgi:predicted aconitase with swiveling domain